MTHARWQPVTQSARCRRSYGKIEDCEQSTQKSKNQSSSILSGMNTLPPFLTYLPSIPNKYEKPYHFPKMPYVASPVRPLLVQSRHQALLPSTVDSRYCGHPRGEDLASVIAAGCERKQIVFSLNL